MEQLKNRIPLSYISKVPRLRTGANREIALDREFETVEISEDAESFIENFLKKVGLSHDVHSTATSRWAATGCEIPFNKYSARVAPGKAPLIGL